MKEEFIQRYSRQLILPGFGTEAQKKLSAASVLVIGAGGLGVPVMQYLTAAGVGRLVVADDDVVELHNLQRQVLYGRDDIGSNKVELAARRLQAINPHVRVEAWPERITSQNALSLLKDFDLVMDCTDNLVSRYLINDACFLNDIPMVYGSLFQYEGQLSVFHLPLPDGSRSPNYRDLFPLPPPPGQMTDCSEGGVLGTLPGIIGTLMASEAVKILARIGEQMHSRLFLFDALRFKSRALRFAPHPENPLRGNPPPLRQLIDYEAFCGISESFVPAEEEMEARELRDRMQSGSKITLLDVREPGEYELTSIGGINIPASQLKEKLSLLKGQEALILICRSGIRSARLLPELKAYFPDREIYHLRGGLLAWKAEVDPGFPMY